MNELTPRRRLRELLGRTEPLVAPGVYDCLSARIVEQAGFNACLITGAGVSASLLGEPDVGLLSMVEVLTQTRNIVNAVDICVIADCDTGYGNALNVMRTIREFEAAGVAGLFIEDQIMPKRCGHFQGKEVVSAHEMVRKIEAAVEARTDPNLVIIARTDARATHGLPEALDRARAYAQAGADGIFVEAPQTHEELVQIGVELAPLGLPLMANMVEGGKTPLHNVNELASLGFRLICFSGSLQKVAIKAMQDFIGGLRATGSVEDYVPDRMVSLAERNSLLRLPTYYELEQRFAVHDDAAL